VNGKKDISSRIFADPFNGLKFDENYGRAIAALRIQTNLRQHDIRGLSVKQVGRIESGRQRVTASAISCLARAHQLPGNQYMQRIAELMRPEKLALTERHRVRKPQIAGVVEITGEARRARTQ
jgi:transcriptional regulator with XRE-family HTH domain